MNVEATLVTFRFTDDNHQALESITINLKDLFAEYGYIPRTNAIPIELYEQVIGERDVAVEQLKALNIELFEKPYRKAIPIDWLKKFANERALNDGMDCYWHFWGEDLLQMIDQWEKENETESE